MRSLGSSVWHRRNNIELMTREKRAQKVAIIGAGASGSVALNVLSPDFDVKLFERRDRNGGVWILDKEKDDKFVSAGSSFVENDPQREIPVELNNVEIGNVIKSGKVDDWFIYTPSYDGIRTNVPEHFMTFSDVPKWPVLDKPGIDPFTRREYVEQYLNEYIKHNEHLVQYNTTLEKLDKDDKGFILTLRKNTAEGSEWFRERFDAVVLAIGHYHVPYIPDVPGLKQVQEKFPDKVTYAKAYRNEKYEGETVLVIGGSASGIDISNVVSRTAERVVRSERSNTNSRPTLQRVEIRDTVESYTIEGEKIIAHFKEEDGEGDKSIAFDRLIFGTGYDYSYPFLRHLYPDFSAGGYLPQSYQHTFHIPDPLISTPGVPIGALSFRAFEYQSILISRYLKGQVDLPSVEKQWDWVKERESRLEPRMYHRIGSENVVKYLADLTELGGGVEGDRAFPVVTYDDVANWKDERLELAKKWENEEGNPDLISWGSDRRADPSIKATATVSA